MAVHWSPSSSKAPVADYRDLNAWQESTRYKEITEAKNKQNAPKIKIADL